MNSIVWKDLNKLRLFSELIVNLFLVDTDMVQLKIFN